MQTKNHQPHLFIFHCDYSMLPKAMGSTPPADRLILFPRHGLLAVASSAQAESPPQQTPAWKRQPLRCKHLGGQARTKNKKPPAADISRKRENRMRFLRTRKPQPGVKSGRGFLVSNVGHPGRAELFLRLLRSGHGAEQIADSLFDVLHFGDYRFRPFIHKSAPRFRRSAH